MSIPCHEILNNSRAVRTRPLPEVKKLFEKQYPSLTDVYPYRTKVGTWLKPIIDLSDYYVYPTNGITEGLNWWLGNEKREIHTEEGDYQWVLSRTGKNGEIRYISVPSAIDGNFRSLSEIQTPIALDLAYLGSTKISRISIDSKVEFAFFSLSKAFGIQNIRTGWLFTKKPQPRLHDLIYQAKYYNYFAHKMAEKIINTFPVDWVYNKLGNHQVSICEKYSFTPSDSVWLATTQDKLYDKFKRAGVNRLCLTKCYWGL